MTALSDAVPSWEEFIQENLLKSALFRGVCLLSYHGEIVYTYGQLKDLPEDTVKQFLKAFLTTNETAEQTLIQKGFRLASLLDNQLANFKIYHKTYYSIYSTSIGGKAGLTVNRLPYGVLVCLFTHPISAFKAIPEVEKFCDRLRS